MAESFLKRFSVTAPPNSYARRVAALAVVVPLAGFGKPDALAQKALGVISRWRARIGQLDERGWDMTQHRKAIRARNGNKAAFSRKWRMLNCRPSAFAATPKTPVCGTVHICPHCWGRRTITHWYAIDTSLFGARPARSKTRPRLFGGPQPQVTLVGMSLVLRTATYPFPFDGISSQPLLPDVLTRRLAAGRLRVKPDALADSVPIRYLEQRRMRQMGVIGGLESITIVPTVVDGSPWGWSFTIRQLLVIPNGDVNKLLVNPWLFPCPRGYPSPGSWDPRTPYQQQQAVKSPYVRAKVIHEPNRYRLLAAVASVCRYSPFLLEGPAKYVFTLLAATAGRRMTTAFGVCMKPKAGRNLPAKAGTPT